MQFDSLFLPSPLPSYFILPSLSESISYPFLWPSLHLSQYLPHTLSSLPQSAIYVFIFCFSSFRFSAFPFSIFICTYLYLFSSAFAFTAPAPHLFMFIFNTIVTCIFFNRHSSTLGDKNCISISEPQQPQPLQ